jgi:lipoprotein NlpD
VSGTARAAALALALASGCVAPAHGVRPPPEVPLQAAPYHEEPALAGVVHVVKRGETVYRIARAYGIDPADLMETNGITDPRAVSAGAELFVPGAQETVDAGGAADATPTPASSSSADRTASPAASGAPAPLPGGPRPLGKGPSAVLAWPLKGVLYGRYGVRAGQRHDGIDIAAPEGAPVGAAADGTVLYAGEQPAYGAVVILKHEGGLVTLYAHNAKVLVREGERVRRGDPIARVGQTGRTTGPHLHFEVREGTRPRNPLLFLP